MPAQRGRELEEALASEKAAREALEQEVAVLKTQAAEAALALAGKGACNEEVKALKAQNASLCAEVSALKHRAEWADARIQALAGELLAERNLRLSYEADEEARLGRNRVARRFLCGDGR